MESLPFCQRLMHQLLSQFQPRLFHRGEFVITQVEAGGGGTISLKQSNRKREWRRSSIELMKAETEAAKKSPNIPHCLSPHPHPALRPYNCCCTTSLMLRLVVRSTMRIPSLLLLPCTAVFLSLQPCNRAIKRKSFVL